MMNPFKLIVLTALICLSFPEYSMSQEKRFEPNDYGTTAKKTKNLGLDVPLDYLDFLGMPKAWYYTTGRPDVIVGISDAFVDSTNVEFKGKTTVFRLSPLIKGHGIGVAAIAAAQGDNGYGVPGICYDCGIYSTTFGDFRNLDALMELSRAGVKVINCSWVGSAKYPSAQDSINKLFSNGTLVVAGAGNTSWKSSQGHLKYFPASYDHVISVASGMYKYENPLDHLLYEENGNPYVENIRGFVGRTAGFLKNDLSQPLRLYPQSTTTLNEDVDLLAPTAGVLRFKSLAMENKIETVQFEASSTAAPFVTGTIGLMFSLYPCLPIDEVESILKITAMNIDDIEVNKPYKGMYGAGLLQTGDAVEMVYQLYNEKEIAYIDNQDFSRWNFKITAHSKEVVIRNQKFKEEATLELVAKNKIIIQPNTILKPNEKGKISFRIQGDLTRECDLILRDPSIVNEN
jgi:subtilisin family serine protease